MSLQKELENLKEELKQYIPQLKNQRARENSIAEFDAVVKEWGSSAHIPVQRKFAKHKVRVIVSKDKIEEEPKE